MALPSPAPPALFDGDGRPVALGPRLGRGGEGAVFEVAGDPSLCAKVLHAGREGGKLAKVRAMVEAPPAGAYGSVEGFPVLTWPRALLFSDARRRDDATFRGYLMARVARGGMVPFYQLTSTARRQELGGTLTWDKLVLLGMRMCHLVRTLHRFGYAVGDLNDRNVLVSRRLTPLLMDTDSFQVPKPGLLGGHFPSVVGDAQYWPPELLDTDLAAYKGDRAPGDRYALGVLLFQLFMGGLRPYQARGSKVAGLETLAEKTRAGHYPWADPRPGVLEPPASAPSYQALPKPVRQAFERCFVAGHRDPRRRPTADEWHAVLAQVHAEGFQACARDARHVHGRSARACPWCADARDPFTARRPARPAAPAVARMAPRPRAIKGGGRGPRAAKPKGPPQRPMAPAVPVLPATSPPPPAPTPPKPAKPASPRPQATRRPRRQAQAKRARRGRRGARPAARRLPHRLPMRGAWLGGLLLAFASPAWVLQAMPGGWRKDVVAAAATGLLALLLGWTAAWRWLRGGARLAALWLWLVAVAAAVLALAGVGRWGWLTYGAGVACVTLGAAAFVALERGRPDAFRPTAAGLRHAAAGLPLAYLPVLATWLWAAA